jgi:AcrR family transcriptional regulator
MTARGPRRLTQEARKAKTRKAVLSAAARLFARQGIEATSLEDIANAIGVTKGAIYANFASKRAVIDAVAEARALRYDFASLLRADRTLSARLAQVGRDVAVLGLTTSRPTALLDLEYGLDWLRNPGRRKRHRSAELTARKELTKELRAVNARRRETGRLGPGELVAVVMLLMRGVVRDRLESPSPIRPKTVESVFRLLAEPGPPRRSARRR